MVVVALAVVGVVGHLQKYKLLKPATFINRYCIYKI
jgi:hypothetical protein